MRRPEGPADWFAYAYLVCAALVFVALVAVHLIGPW
jgi:hypothetical protein